MGNDKLLNHIKDQVRDHKVGIDHNALWSSIQPKIAVGTATGTTAITTPVWLQFILNGGFVLAIFATTLMIAGFNSEDAIAAQAADAEQNSPSETAALTLVEDAEKSIEAIHENTANVASNAITSADSEANVVNENSLSKDGSIATKKGIKKTSIAATTTNFAAEEENTAVSNASMNTAIVEVDNRKQEDLVYDAIEKPANSVNTTLLGEQESTPNTDSYASMKVLEPVTFIGVTSLKEKLKTSIPRRFDLGNTDCPTFGNRGPNPWSIFAYTGPNMTFKTLSSQSSEFDAYLEDRESTESSLESFRSGLGIKYAFQNGIYIKAGIEHLRINEKFNTSFTRDTTRILEDQIIQIIVHSVGDTTFVRGDLPISETITQNWEVYNKFNAISFPISLGYEVYNRKWSYFAEAGVVINTSFNFSGAIINQAGRPTQDPAIFKDRTGLGLHLTAGIGYSLTPNFKVNLSPSYFTILDPVNNQNNNIDQEYGTLGLLLGGEYKF